MNPIPGYNESPAYTGEVMQLPAGLYVCVVKQVNVQNDKNGKEQMIVLFDIADGEQKGFYQRQYDTRKKSSTDAKWGGVYKQFTHDKNGETNPWWKGMICSIEKSNNGYLWDWNEKGLVGKRFGGVFGREEFYTQDGQKKLATKLVHIRSVDGLKDATIPEDKLLPDAPVTADPLLAASGAPDNMGFMNIPDGLENEQLPFM